MNKSPKPLSAAQALLDLRIRGLFCLALLVGVLGAACSRPETIEFDERFSVNLVRVPDWFPGKLQVLTPAENEVMQRRGRPDFIRFWWRPDGEYISSSDFSGQRDKLVEGLDKVKRTWVYALGHEKGEIEFLPKGGYDVHPLTDQLETICLYGDPRQKAPPKTDKEGRLRESWLWIDRGLKIEFLDGQIVSKTRHPATGAGTDLLK